jgi:hypothetical protein
LKPKELGDPQLLGALQRIVCFARVKVQLVAKVQEKLRGPANRAMVVARQCADQPSASGSACP